jgi:hypothetical protein
MVDNHIEIYFLPPEHNRSLKGSLAAYTTRDMVPDDDWDRIREEAWSAAAAEKVRGWDVT